MEPSRYFIRRIAPLDTEIEAQASPVFPDDGEPLIDVWAYWRTIRKHLRLVVGVFVAVMVLTAIHVMTETPLYTAVTTIMIEPNTQQSSNSLENLVEIEAAAYNSEQYYKTQCAILQSRNLAANVIRTLGLEHNPYFVGKPAKPGIFSQLFSAVTGVLKKKSANPGHHPSVALADDIGNVPLSLVHLYLGELKVSSIPDTNLVKISFVTPNPELSAELANAHVAAYRRQQIELHSKSSEEAERFLQGKLIQIKEQLQKTEAALNDYRRKKGIIPGLMSLDGKDTMVLTRLSDLSKDLTAAQVARIGLEAQMQLVKKHEYSSLPEVMNDPAIRSMQNGLNGLFSKSAALSSEFKPDYPPLARLRAQIDVMQAQINREVTKIVQEIQLQYQEAVAKETELQAEMDKQRTETLNLNDAAAEYAILERDVGANRELYNAVLTRLKDVTVSGDIQSTNVSTINSAEVPQGPTTPRKQRDLSLAAIAGLAGGVGLAFLVEMLDNTLKSPEEAESYLKLPNLGVVPEFSSVNGKSVYGPRQLTDGASSTVLPPGRELVTSHGSYSQIGEAYRNLRTALLLSRAGGPPRMTLITSAMSREGKTVTAVNMAIMLAQLGGNVLLMDADLRRARCHRVLAVDNHLGLTEVLTGARDLHDMIRATEIDNLYFLSAGSVPPNPTELLGSSKMAELLVMLREHYEYIVLDSPPVLPVSDSLLLGKLTDGVMLIANGSATPRQQVRAACARLEYARAKILGVVLNKVKARSASGYGYYYNQDYYSFENGSIQDEEESA